MSTHDMSTADTLLKAMADWPCDFASQYADTTCVVLTSEKPPDKVVHINGDEVVNYVPELTCHIVEDEDTGFLTCSECGAIQPEDYTTYYCWCCGARIEER